MPVSKTPSPGPLAAVTLLAIGLGGVLIAYGVWALEAARRSAAAGGGLLGSFGLLPIALGVLLIAAGAGAAALWLSRSLRRG